MQEILNAGWFSLAVGSFLSLASIWLALVLYKRGRIASTLRAFLVEEYIKCPSGSTHGQSLEVLYRGKPIPRLTLAVFGVWNDGVTTVLGNDIIDSDPLRLEFEESTEILDAFVASSVRIVNKAHADISTKESVEIRFDFLDPGDGFRLHVMHTGLQGSARLRGTIRGIPRGFESPNRVPNIRWFTRWAAHICLMVPVGAAAYFVGLQLQRISAEPWIPNIPFASMVVAIYLAISAVRAREAPLSYRIRSAPRVVVDGILLAGWPSRSPDEPER